MQLKKLALTASAMAILAAPAMAADNEGFYIGGHGGWNMVTDRPTKTATTRNNPTEYDDGYLAGLSLGYNFGSGIRNEVEATYRRNSTDRIGTAAGFVDGSGDINSWAFMYNVLYDIDFMHNAAFKPYVGIGAGAVRSKLDAGGFDFGAVDDHDWNFALQGIAGVQYALDYNWGVFADYRYLTTFNNKYDGGAAVGGVKNDYNNSAVVLGLRYTFGSPAQPMAEPAPAPAPMAQPAPVQEQGPVSRKYLVFFDFNKASLTPEAVEVLKQAAADSQGGQAVALDVSGHTDRSGSDSYNQKLSNKRAAAVKAELARLGVSSTSITTMAKGESDPLVPTDDGVKEPQNRRAEITYVIKPQR